MNVNEALLLDNCDNIDKIYALYELELISIVGIKWFIMKHLEVESPMSWYDIMSCADNDSTCIEKCVSRIFDTIDQKTKEWINIVKSCAKIVSKMILSNAISPIEGANIISRAVSRKSLPGTFHDLDTFLYASYEATCRSQDNDIFEKGIVIAATELLGENK